MRETKGDYQKKIDELHGLVEQKARELQAVTEQVEGEKKIREGVREHIIKLRNDLVSIGQVAIKEAELIKSDREKWQKEAIDHDRRVFEERNIVQDLETEALELRKEIKNLNKVQAEVKKEEKLVSGLVASKEDLETQKNKLSSQVESSRIELENNLSRKVDLQKLAGEAMENLLQVHKDTQDFRNKVYFYIRRIVQNYRERGKQAPLVFEEFKPNVPIRADILKKLKLL